MAELEKGSAKQDETRKALLNTDSRDSTTGNSPDDEVLNHSFDTLDEDVYGACIVVLVRDSYHLSKQVDKKFFLHSARMALSLCLLLLMVFLQVFLILQMKRLVSSQAVHEIREAYGHFEEVMYGSDPDHLVNTSKGYPRGASRAFFDLANFDKLSDGEKSTVCQFPLSQPIMLLPIILIWSLTVTNDLRRTIVLMTRLLRSTPTVASMAEAEKTQERDSQVVEVVGLTLTVKTLLAVLVFLPRLGINCFLLWLGSRWLVATPGFSNILQNTVALEFILLLKDTIYGAVIPHRTKRTLKDTLIQPYVRQEAASYWVFLGGFVFFVVAAAWTFLYVFCLQNVIPDYRWDVRPACEQYIARVTSV